MRKIFNECSDNDIICCYKNHNCLFNIKIRDEIYGARKRSLYDSLLHTVTDIFTEIRVVVHLDFSIEESLAEATEEEKE